MCVSHRGCGRSTVGRHLQRLWKKKQRLALFESKNPQNNISHAQHNPTGKRTTTTTTRRESMEPPRQVETFSDSSDEGKYPTPFDPSSIIISLLTPHPTSFPPLRDLYRGPRDRGRIVRRGRGRGGPEVGQQALAPRTGPPHATRKCSAGTLDRRRLELPLLLHHRVHGLSKVRHGKGVYV